ncbi:hypothetical protein ACFPRL_01070 [Pseudoclavibacter helvolus]
MVPFPRTASRRSRASLLMVMGSSSSGGGRGAEVTVRDAVLSEEPESMQGAGVWSAAMFSGSWDIRWGSGGEAAGGEEHA